MTRVLLLGATGYIGSAVLADLLRHGHSVLALAHHARGEKSLAAQGAAVLPGDIRAAEAWAADAIAQVDAVVHLAATFSADMGAVDEALLAALSAAAKAEGRRLRFLYTGGCWLYGATGDRVATESDPLAPLPSFAWMARNFAEIAAAGVFEPLCLHPAMVYDRDGGALRRFIDDAKTTGIVEATGSLQTRWPVVHVADLATAYRLALTHGRPGEAYNIVAEEGVVVGELAAAIARRFGLKQEPRVLSVAAAVAKFGLTADGPALDQQMSGSKARRELGWVPERTSILAEIA